MPIPPLQSLVASNAVLCGMVPAFALVAACEPQASTAYRGEPLLTMSGSVELALESTEGELSPALAFLNSARSEIEIVDVEVKGEFPAEFTIRVYDPPPRSAFVPVLSDEGAPSAALAFITAVTPSHPEAIQFANHQQITQHANVCNGAPCPCPPSGCVRSESELCTHDGQRCFTEKLTCPASDSPEEDCTVEYSGDASVADNPWKSVAGLSENYAVLYVDQAIEAGSPAGITLGTRDALEQGYSLLSIHQLAQQELVEEQQCFEAAGARALERFNREHGTDYSELSILGLGCGPGASDPVLCPEPATSEESEEYYALQEALAAEEGCLRTGYLATRVTDTEAESITIRIGHTFDPLTGPSSGPMEASPPISSGSTPASPPSP